MTYLIDKLPVHYFIMYLNGIVALCFIVYLIPILEIFIDFVVGVTITFSDIGWYLINVTLTQLTYHATVALYFKNSKLIYLIFPYKVSLIKRRETKWGFLFILSAWDRGDFLGESLVSLASKPQKLKLNITSVIFTVN